MNTDKVLALAREACKIGGIDVTTANDQLIMGNRDIIKFAALIQQQMEAENAELRKDAIKWLEDNHTLHTSVEILYVVDGYEVTVMHENGVTPLSKTYHGETLLTAIDRARSANDKG